MFYKYLKIIDFYSLIILNYINIILDSNISFNYLLNKIMIDTFAYYLENGGRVWITSILLNNLYNIRIFNLYLFTIKKKVNNKYLIKEKINRILNVFFSIRIYKYEKVYK